MNRLLKVEDAVMKKVFVGYKNRTALRANFCMYFMGGFICSAHATREFKIISITFLMGNIVYSLTSVFLYLLLLEEFKFSEFMLEFLEFMSVLSMLMCYTIVIFCQQDIEGDLEYQDEHFTFDIDDKLVRDHDRSTKVVASIILSMGIVSIFIKVYDILANHQSAENVQFLFYYPIPQPFLKYVGRSMSRIFLVTFIQSFELLQLGFTIFVVSLYFQTKAGIVLGEYLHLRDCIRELSNTTSNNIDAEYERYYEQSGTNLTWETTRMMEHQLKENVDKHAKTFTENMFQFVALHQKLNQSVDNMKSILELGTSAMLIISVCGSIPSLYLVLEGNGNLSLKETELFIVVSVAILLYGYCYYGENVVESNQMITNEIYATPWYKLPPKHRKFIGIFMTQTQDAKTFKALNYIIIMPLLPRTLNMVYSYVNILRTLTH